MVAFTVGSHGGGRNVRSYDNTGQLSQLTRTYEYVIEVPFTYHKI